MIFSEHMKYQYTAQLDQNCNDCRQYMNQLVGKTSPSTVLRSIVGTLHFLKLLDEKELVSRADNAISLQDSDALEEKDKESRMKARALIREFISNKKEQKLVRCVLWFCLISQVYQIEIADWTSQPSREQLDEFFNILQGQDKYTDIREQVGMIGLIARPNQIAENIHHRIPAAVLKDISTRNLEGIIIYSTNNLRKLALPPKMFDDVRHKDMSTWHYDLVKARKSLALKFYRTVNGVCIFMRTWSYFTLKGNSDEVVWIQLMSKFLLTVSRRLVEDVIRKSRILKTKWSPCFQTEIGIR